MDPLGTVECVLRVGAVEAESARGRIGRTLTEQYVRKAAVVALTGSRAALSSRAGVEEVVVRARALGQSVARTWARSQDRWRASCSVGKTGRADSRRGPVRRGCTRRSGPSSTSSSSRGTQYTRLSPSRARNAACAPDSNRRGAMAWSV